MSSSFGRSTLKNHHQRSLPMVKRLLHASHKSYAAIGRRVRPHFGRQRGGGKQQLQDSLSDSALGKSVVNLLAPIISKHRASHRFTRRKRMSQNGGGVHDKMPNTTSNETVLRKTCIDNLSKMCKWKMAQSFIHATCFRLHFFIHHLISLKRTWLSCLHSIIWSLVPLHISKLFIALFPYCFSS